MKKLLSLLSILITLSSCNFTAEKVDNKEEIKKQPLSLIEKKKEVKQLEQKKPIEQFLQQLKMAVKKDDVEFVENCLKFPFEFNSGGESSFYDNYTEMKDKCDRFSYILKAEVRKFEGGEFSFIYREPNVPDYFVVFYGIKEGNKFKLTGFSQPH